MTENDRAQEANITLRTDLQPGDLGAIVALHGTLYAQEYGYDLTFEGYVAQALGHFAQPYDASRERVWLAELNGRPVGCIGIIRSAPSQAQLRWFLVAPQARGRGLGRKLLHEAIQFARSAGYESVFLETVAGLEEAAHLYLAAGFVKTGAQEILLGGRSVTLQRYELHLQDAAL